MSDLKLYFHIPKPKRFSNLGWNHPHDIKEIHFNPSTVVRDALKQIRTQYNFPDDTEKTRLGLFMMNDDYEFWLDDESPFDKYSLKAEDHLYIKENDSIHNIMYFSSSL